MAAAGVDRSALEGLVSAEISRRTLIDFCLRISPGFQNVRHARFLCNVLEQVERGDLKRVILCAPPGFGKSTLLQAWSAWFLGRKPSRRVLMLSAAEKLALRNSRIVRDYIRSEAWPWDDLSISEDSSAVGQWEIRGAGGLRAIGQGGTVTGFRCEAIVCDDVQADQGSPATRDTLEEWFRGVLTTRLEPDGVVVLIQTRWSTDDSVARLEQGESGAQWTIINLRAIGQGDDPPGLVRETFDGGSLWPERWPVEVLLSRKAEVGSAVFESQYMGNPLPDGGRIFDGSWFPRYNALPSPEPVRVAGGYSFEHIFGESGRPQAPPALRVTALDAALKNSLASDFSALCTVEASTTGLHVIEIERRRVAFEDLLRMTIDHFNRNRSQALLIEDNSLGSPAITSLRNHTLLPVIPVQAIGSKESRAMAIVPLAEAGKIHLPNRAHWMNDFLIELTTFPGARNDDQVDAFVMAVTYAQALLARSVGTEQLARDMNGWMAR